VGLWRRVRRGYSLCAPATTEFGDRLLNDQFEASLPRRICTDAGSSRRGHIWSQIRCCRKVV